MTGEGRRNLPRPTRDALAYIVEHGVRLLLVGVTGVLIARHLGPESFGLLSYALGLMAIATSIASLGMRSILVREFATRPDWRPTLVSATSLQAAFGGVAAVAGTALILVTRSGESGTVLLALSLLPLPLLTTTDSFRAMLEAAGELRQIARASIGAAFLGSALKVTSVVLGAPVWVFAALTSLEVGLLGAGLAWGRVPRHFITAIKRLYSHTEATRLLRESWPLLLASIATVGYMRVDIAMLGLILGDGPTGQYAVATRVSEIAYFVPVAAAASIMPRLSRTYASGDHPTYLRLTRRFIALAFYAAVAIAAVTVLLADRLIPLVFGSIYTDAATILKLHVAAAPFVFIGVASSQWFIDMALTKVVMARAIAGMVLNVALNLALIPWFGPVGAAASTLISYAATGILMNALYGPTRALLRIQVGAMFGGWR